MLVQIQPSRLHLMPWLQSGRSAPVCKTGAFGLWWSESTPRHYTGMDSYSTFCQTWRCSYQKCLFPGSSVVQSGCPTSIGSGVQLPPRELLLIRRQNDWFVCHSDKVEVVGSTPTLRTILVSSFNGWIPACHAGGTGS